MKAYAILSADERAQEPYDVFLHDMEFTLLPGCWMIGQDFVSQIDSQTGDVGIEMTQVSCIDGSPSAFFYWHFRVQVQNGRLVITSIGLYPTGVGNG